MTDAVVATREWGNLYVVAGRHAARRALQQWAAAPRMRVLSMLMVINGGRSYRCVRSAHCPIGGWGGRGGNMKAIPGALELSILLSTPAANATIT